MQMDVIDWNNEKTGSVDLADDVFRVDVKKDVIARVIHWQLAKRRAGTHLVKTRSTVSGTTKKPWKQKGTGSARAGSRRGTQWRHGGIVFGPVVRDYAYALNKKIRRLGLKCALAHKLATGRLMVVDGIEAKSLKTKDLSRQVSGLGIKTALVVAGGEQHRELRRAAGTGRERVRHHASRYLGRDQGRDRGSGSEGEIMALLGKKKKVSEQDKAKVNEAAYDIVVAPVVTEKAMKSAESEQVTFKVALKAAKPAIKKAVESLFGVKVKAVNTSVTEGKAKRFRGRLGKRSDYKKAVVTLVKGQQIDLSKGVR